MAFPEVTVVFWHTLVAMVAMQMIGWVWYGPLFGKMWMKLAGVKKANVGGARMSVIILTSVIVNVLTATILSHFLAYADATTFMEGVTVVFWLWLGFMMPLQLGKVLGEGKPVKLFILLTAYDLVALSAAAKVLLALA
ncbi:DUF1761 domain-containing protein [Candidatus Pacearchaeota archaeon]|nr:DUF1761 domain-containing protein [Candidatus Pacearchaeota archaeon]